MIFKILNKFFLFFALSFLVLGASFSHAAIKGAGSKEKKEVNAPQGTPTRAIQEIERKMDKYHTGKDLTAAQKEENRRLKREILRGTFDIRALAQQSLGRHWKTLSETQRSNFVNLMTELLETKALFSKEQSKTRGKAYTVTYKGDEYSNNHNRSLTRTLIYVPEKNVKLEMNYTLKRTGQDWKIVDIIADGASLAENYEYQFDQIIKKDGYDELVNRMQKKLDELKKKRSTGA